MASQQNKLFYTGQKKIDYKKMINGDKMKLKIYSFILFVLSVVITNTLSFAELTRDDFTTYESTEKAPTSQQDIEHDLKILKELIGNLTPAQQGVIKLPDGSYTPCYQIEEFKGYDTRILCEEYVNSSEKTQHTCLSDRIKGNETKEGIREIHNICFHKGVNAGMDAAKWIIRKEKIKTFFK